MDNGQRFTVNLKDLAVSLFGHTEPGCCIDCKKPFVWGVNVHTEEGKRETELSHLCEDCFNDIASAEDEEFPF